MCLVIDLPFLSGNQGDGTCVRIAWVKCGCFVPIDASFVVKIIDVGVGYLGHLSRLSLAEKFTN